MNTDYICSKHGPVAACPGNGFCDPSLPHCPKCGKTTTDPILYEAETALWYDTLMGRK